MKTIFAFSLSIFALLFSFTLYAQVSPIKIKQQSEKPIIEARLNGKRAYFLLDTGSGVTVLDKTQAKHYNFGIKQLINPHKVSGVHGTAGVMNRAYNVQLELGELYIEAPYFTHDLRRVIKSIRDKSLVKISGIIGSDVMNKYGFVIDYGEEMVYVEREDPNNLADISYTR
ncbi:aspartyl protease family protein [Porifericola rhodea]|uniref:aspartyl protease family protein n=1 Tax=Porifericola rhodea TaxID=930972 RepID=UPI002666CE22|nr:aspartyl protease family protein [Porifericola rhodea]WKN33520.1 aspartyl protease family protein [Porifericola rhodea]